MAGPYQLNPLSLSTAISSLPRSPCAVYSSSVGHSLAFSDYSYMEGDSSSIADSQTSASEISTSSVVSSLEKARAKDLQELDQLLETTLNYYIKPHERHFLYKLSPQGLRNKLRGVPKALINSLLWERQEQVKAASRMRRMTRPEGQSKLKEAEATIQDLEQRLAFVSGRTDVLAKVA